MNHDEVAYLAHFGVKGMKWGVNRSESHTNGVSGRQAVGVVPPSHNNVRGNYKARLASAQKRSISDAAAIRKRDEATSKVYDKEYKKARASGQGHIKAFKTANAATAKRRDSDAKADVATVDRYDKAVKNAKAQKKAEHHQNVVTQRANAVQQTFGTGNGIASSLLLGPQVTYGYNVARASGASKAGAAATSLVMGAWAGATYRMITGQ